MAFHDMDRDLTEQLLLINY